MKMKQSDRDYIIKDILGYTEDELRRINMECNESECEWCRWKHSCIFDDFYLQNVYEDLFR